MTIGIIGYGNFGSFLHEMLRRYRPDIEVRVFSSHHKEDNATFFPFADVCTSDALVFAVPIHAFEGVLEKVLPHRGKQTVIVDVATVKSHPIAVLKRHPTLPYIATHPMFGPESFKKRDSLKGLRLVLSSHTLAPEVYQRVKRELAELGLVILEKTPDEHDRMLAETLFLTHLIGQEVKAGGFKRTDIDTVSFGYLIDMVESVAHDAALFHDVYTYNPHCKEVLARFEEAATEVVAKLRSENRS